MDIQSEKLDLIQWLAELDDLKTIKLISSLKLYDEATQEPLSKELKAALDQSLQEVEEGKTVSYAEVMRLTKQKFPQLFN